MLAARLTRVRERRAQSAMIAPECASFDYLSFRASEPGDTPVQHHRNGYDSVIKMLPLSPDGRRKSPKALKRGHRSGKYPGVDASKVYLEDSQLNSKNKVAVVFLYRDTDTGLLRIYMVEQRTSHCINPVKGGVEDLRQSIQAVLEVYGEIGVMASPEYFENVCPKAQMGRVTVYAVPLSKRLPTRVVDVVEISRILEVPLRADPDGEADIFMYINQGRVTETTVKILGTALAMLRPLIDPRNIHDISAVDEVVKNCDDWAAIAKRERRRIIDAIKNRDAPKEAVMVVGVSS